MTEEEFLKLINDYVRGLLCHSENWKYHLFKIVTEKCSDSGRTEIRIQYSPYKVENREAKEVKKSDDENDCKTYKSILKRYTSETGEVVYFSESNDKFIKWILRNIKNGVKEESEHEN